MTPDSRSSIAVMWINLSHYHCARIRALTTHFRVTAIEFTARQRQYDWVHDARDLNCAVRTLNQEDWSDANPLSIARALWKTLNEVQPDAMLIPGYSNLPALTAAAWGRVHHRPCILMNESTGLDKSRRLIAEGLKRALIQTLFDTTVVGGTRTFRYSLQMGFRPGKIARYYDVVDNNYYQKGASAARKSRSSPCAHRYFLYVGRLASEKNLEFLLSSFADYRRSGGELHLVLAGGGPLAGKLEALATSLGLQSSVHSAGRRSTPELLVYYAHAHSLVLPSLSEPWGLVVNEAMATGLPVIVSDRCGCVDDLVQDGVNGFVIDPEDSTSLTTTLHKMESLPVTTYANMAERSARIIQEFSPEAWADSIRRLVAH